jgi:hypothetical protein
VTFASSFDALRAWRATRVPLPRYLALAAFLARAALLGDAPHFAHALTNVVLAFTLVVQFRLWDDLTDRSRDRIEHPERILAVARDLRPFVAAAWCIGVGNAVALAGGYGMSTCLGFLVLNAAIAAWYRLHRKRGLTHIFVLYLKYPAFVLLLASAHSTASAVSPQAYAALVAFELARRGPAARPCGRQDALSALRRRIHCSCVRHYRRSVVMLALKLRQQPESESINCYACGAGQAMPFIQAEDDLTGKPGRFQFVRCQVCALVYQRPRIPAAAIADWYDDEYIAHRKKTDFGLFTGLYNWAMDRHDQRKLALIERYTRLDANCATSTSVAAPEPFSPR